MKEQDQIKALAELDGWKIDLEGQLTHPDGRVLGFRKSHFKVACDFFNVPDYHRSYDAIIPLVQKVCADVRIKEAFLNNLAMLFYGGEFEQNKWRDMQLLAWHWSVPSMLCEALLRATNKWKEGE